MRLAIITTHPIQYYAPVFKLLHERRRVDIKVFYTWGEAAINKYDPDFRKKITWDIPLLENYPYEWVKNTAADPGSHHFKGIINPGLIKQIIDYKPDAILFIGWAYHSHLKAMRYFKNKVPVFFRGDSTLLDEKPTLRSFLKTLFLKWIYGYVDHAFYNGTNNKAYFKKYGLKDNQLTFAPHAVDNERFKISRETEAKELRTRLGLNDEDTLILFAGKFAQKKDPQILLDAVLKINKPNIHLLFTGNGPLEAALKSRAQHSPNIHFIGFQNQTYMPVVYQACNLFCLPSKGPGESWGLAVNEAMACGKAILVSDKCGCAIDLVINNKNGAIFKSESIDDLIAHLSHLTKTKNTLTEFGKRSAAAIENWDFLTIDETIEHTLVNEAQR